MNTPLLSLKLPGITKTRSGKVREMFDLGESLLMVASDRISAFDVILPHGIPDKGRVLTQISRFWFGQTEGWMPNHLISCEPPIADPRLAGRCMVVKKTTPLPVECVVRGYLSGSGWKEYREHGTLAGEPLPAGLSESSPLPEPRFTPATKADTGHDMNISCAEASSLLGEAVFQKVRDYSLRLYNFAHSYAVQRGIIVADTKFEFGLLDGEVILIDEALTPDSSRFWPADQYRAGGSQPSFDKQYLRDYLETLDWDKTPPGPALPDLVIEQTAAKYREAYRLLTGHNLPEC